MNKINYVDIDNYKISVLCGEQTVNIEGKNCILNILDMLHNADMDDCEIRPADAISYEGVLKSMDKWQIVTHLFMYKESNVYRFFFDKNMGGIFDNLIKSLIDACGVYTIKDEDMPVFLDKLNAILRVLDPSEMTYITASGLIYYGVKETAILTKANVSVETYSMLSEATAFFPNCLLGFIFNLGKYYYSEKCIVDLILEFDDLFRKYNLTCHGQKPLLPEKEQSLDVYNRYYGDIENMIINTRRLLNYREYVNKCNYQYLDDFYTNTKLSSNACCNGEYRISPATEEEAKIYSVYLPNCIKVMNKYPMRITRNGKLAGVYYVYIDSEGDLVSYVVYDESRVENLPILMRIVEQIYEMPEYIWLCKKTHIHN